MTPTLGLVIYMPPKAVADAVGKMLMKTWASISTHTSGLNQLRTLLSPERGAVNRSARNTINRMAVSVASGIILRN